MDDEAWTPVGPGWEEMIAILQKGESVFALLRTPNGPSAVSRRVRKVLENAGLAIEGMNNHWTPNSAHGLIECEVSGGAYLIMVWSPGKEEEFSKIEKGIGDVERFKDLLSSSNIGNSTMRLMSYINYPEG